MSNQFTHIKEELIARGLSNGGFQNNDCTVKALAVVKNISYPDAVTYAELMFGRKTGKGPSLNGIVKGFKMDNQVEELPEKAIKTKYKVNNKVVTRSMTVGTFIKEHTKGKYFIVVSRHALAVVDGVIIDHHEGLRRPIQKAWRYKEDQRAQ